MKKFFSNPVTLLALLSTVFFVTLAPERAHARHRSRVQVQYVSPFPRHFHRHSHHYRPGYGFGFYHSSPRRRCYREPAIGIYFSTGGRSRHRW